MRSTIKKMHNGVAAMARRPRSKWNRIRQFPQVMGWLLFRIGIQLGSVADAGWVYAKSWRIARLERPRHTLAEEIG